MRNRTMPQLLRAAGHLSPDAVAASALTACEPAGETARDWPVHYGAIILATREISVLLPPVGVSLLVTRSVGWVEPAEVAPPLRLALLWALILIIAFLPGVLLFLPNLLGVPRGPNAWWRSGIGQSSVDSRLHPRAGSIEINGIRLGTTCFRF